MSLVGRRIDVDVREDMVHRHASVLELRERDFERESRLTGSVSLYREEQIGFEVGGRVISVIDLGKEVQGPAFSETGENVCVFVGHSA